MQEGQPQTVIQPEPQGEWQYKPEGQVTGSAVTTDTPRPAQNTEVHWTASEYVAHQKGVGWFLLLTLAVAGTAVMVYFLTKEVVPVVVTVILGLSFGVFGARQPLVLTYVINEHGLTVGQRFYPYSSFKTFSIIDEGPLRSILLMPLKRFMPPLTIYFEEKDEEKIFEVLGNYLPFEQRKHDVVDQFMRKIRF
ncbi:MAG: hypothetical protein JWL85_1000 [Candidatus Saccharibacteria bacterium]|nr:hypothetical protein [Candidatus Saccharibacteria bacterium]